MSNRAVAAGVFRAWGVMWSVNVLVGLPQLLNELLRHNRGWNDKAMENYVLSSQTIALGCEIIVVVFLFRKADWLASLVFPVEHEVGFSFGAVDLRSVLFSAVGLYFVLDGARRAIGSAYQIVASRPHRNSLEAVGDLWQRDPENLGKRWGQSCLMALSGTSDAREGAQSLCAARRAT